MQALILAAGMGSRLAPLTTHSTKCMLHVHGKRLIEHLLDGLHAIGIQHAIVVIGHGAEEVRMALGSVYNGIEISFIENREYQTTNNSYSVALAASHLCSDDTLLIESDLILELAILQACLNAPHPTVAAVARYLPWMDGTMTRLNPDRTIREFIPKSRFDPAIISQYYKTVNLYKISQAFASSYFVPLLHQHLAIVGSHMYYETIFEQIVAQSLAPMHALVVDGMRWYEIDTFADLAAAEALFAG